ncbi:Hypothetical_protein [Hexamita inflata]|uniref:Hypothetical_protein n=1 Tax=Hexamita inflata TaxID=28002 RepID=A0ABP1GGZ1_9EUKA
MEQFEIYMSTKQLPTFKSQQENQKFDYNSSLIQKLHFKCQAFGMMPNDDLIEKLLFQKCSILELYIKYYNVQEKVNQLSQKLEDYITKSDEMPGQFAINKYQ